MAIRDTGRALDVVAVAAIVKIVLTLLASTYLLIPPLPLLPVGLPFLSGVGMLALKFASIWLRRSPVRVVARLPFIAENRRAILWGAAGAGAVIVLLAIMVGVTGPHPWPAGPPVMKGGRYYLNAHGVLTEITELEYRRYWKAVMQPLFLIPAIFDLITLTNLVSMAKEKKVAGS